MGVLKNLECEVVEVSDGYNKVLQHSLFISVSRQQTLPMQQESNLHRPHPPITNIHTPSLSDLLQLGQERGCDKALEQSEYERGDSDSDGL